MSLAFRVSSLVTRIATEFKSVRASITTLSQNTEPLGLSASTTTTLRSGYVRYIVHGTSTTTARPTGAGLVIWVGSVVPANMLDTDIRVVTD